MNAERTGMHAVMKQKEHAMNNAALVLLVRAKLAFGEVYDALPTNGMLEDDARVILKLIRRLEEDLEKEVR